jgi:hypothetical protein
MAITNFNLRGLDTEVMSTLKKEAKKQQTSVNVLILKLIEQGIGFSREIKRPVYHDLDKLAGTWSAKEAKEFEKHTQYFEKIDKDLWS